MSDEGKHWGTADGWQVEARPAPPELSKDFQAPPFVEPEPLRNDTDQWLEIGRRLSDSDLAALQKVLGIAADVMS